MRTFKKRLVKATIGGAISMVSVIFGFAILNKEIERTFSIIVLWILSFVGGLLFLFEAFKK